MNALINSVVPSQGVYCLATILDNAIQQNFYDDLDDLVVAGHEASAIGRNSYYAMASFKDSSSRTQQNVRAVKSFWLDVDCKDKDPSKDYASKEEGREAIVSFIKAHKLPLPTVVDSGNGWHVYWILEEELTPEVWQPVANKLKTICLKNGLRIDPACTADSARILRIPDTFNYRYDPPSRVELIKQRPAVSFAEFSKIVEVAYEPFRALDNPHTHRTSAVTQALLGNTESSFKKIMVKSLAGTGCPQILAGVQNQADIDEPLWRGILSIAQYCKDRVKAIVAVSNQHPAYNEHEAFKKAEQTKGPYTCVTFDNIAPGVCQNCPNWGAITSPITLGKEVIATKAPVVVNIAPEPFVEPLNDLDELTLEEELENYEQEIINVVIPMFPAPYLRGQNGGIYKKTKCEDGTFDDVLIYENDFYAHARLYDPVDGQVLACRLHLPLDGIRNFNIPLQSVGSKDRLREVICKQGVAATDKTVSELSNYLIMMAKELQQVSKEEQARTQMGWQADGSFVIGNREYSKTGIRNCPPSNATINYQPKFRMEGELSEWKKVINVYNRPGFDIHQFVFLVAISSPLLKHLDTAGMLTSMISDESGLGKTTLCMACNSVWGHPEELMSMPHDTVASLINRMGVFHSMAVVVDELTNKESKTCSDIVYMATHGIGPNRMTSGANIERVNNTKWNLNVLATANASIRDKVSSLKASSEGENMRLFEFDMRGTPALPKAEADSIFPLMYKNYGVAGHLIASWLVKHANEIRDMVAKTQRTLDRRFRFTSKERKWSHSVAAAYTMGYIAKSIGVIDWDIEKNVVFMINHIQSMRGDVCDSVTPHSAVIADFMAEHHSSILIVNGLPDANGLLDVPRNKSISKIIGRYEPDTGMLYLSANILRDYCVKKQFSFSSLRSLSGAQLDNKRLAAGTGIVAAAIRVLTFDTRAADINMAMWED